MWETWWTYDHKAFKVKKVKIRYVPVASHGGRWLKVNARGETCQVGIDIWETEEEARKEGIVDLRVTIAQARQRIAKRQDDMRRMMRLNDEDAASIEQMEKKLAGELAKVANGQ